MIGGFSHGTVIALYTGVFIPRSIFALSLSFLAAACVSGDDSVVGDEEEKSDQVVDYFLPDSATDIQLSDLVSASITYGRCEEVQAPDGVDISIECGTPWSEVSWYRLATTDLAASFEAGASALNLDFGITSQEGIVDRLRVSVHEIDSEGATHKLASESGLFDGDDLTVELQAGTDYYIYVTRGGTPLTSTRTAEYSLTATMQ